MKIERKKIELSQSEKEMLENTQRSIVSLTDIQNYINNKISEMGCKKVEPEFEPLHIVLENKDDVDLFRRILGYGVHYSARYVGVSESLNINDIRKEYLKKCVLKRKK